MKKPIKTIKEKSTGANVKSINIKTKIVVKNKKLIKDQESGKLPNYNVVNSKGKKKFLRSNHDKTKKNNLDPKIRIGKNK